ncbi:MAG: hypothetical protein CMG57_01215 [Candidatus Marinimicrobia bacterium]|nr:hypothetical protein [Candidatus Neomarinimicrobiota bacterium]
MNLNKLVRAAIFAAMAIGLGFMFMLVPNLEFMSVTIFLSGLTLGVPYGAIVGAVAILIYSVMNPLGSGLIYLTLLMGQILAMSGIGIAGGCSAAIIHQFSPRLTAVISGGIGFICSLWYDGVTTLAYPISAGYDWDETVAYAVSGIFFTSIHLLSNTVIFSIVIPGYLKRIHS